MGHSPKKISIIRSNKAAVAKARPGEAQGGSQQETVLALVGIDPKGISQALLFPKFSGCLLALWTDIPKLFSLCWRERLHLSVWDLRKWGLEQTACLPQTGAWNLSPGVLGWGTELSTAGKGKSGYKLYIAMV